MRDTEKVVLRPIAATPRPAPSPLSGACTPRRRPGTPFWPSAARWTAAFLACLSLALLLSLTWHSESEAITEPILLGSTSDLPALATDGHVVAFTRSAGDATTLVVRSLERAEEHVVASLPGRSRLVSVAGEVVAWQEQDCDHCPARVRARRWTDGRDLLAASTDDERLPVLWQRWLAWVSRNGHDRIFIADLQGAQRPPVVALVAEEGVSLQALELRTGRLAWLETTTGGTWRIRSQPIAAPADPTTLREGAGLPPTFLLAGDMLVTVSDAVTVLDLVRGDPPLTVGSIAQPDLVTTDGRYVFWLDPAPPGQNEPAIVAFDTVSASRFVAVPRVGGTVALAAGGGWLVWAQRSDADTVLFAAPIADLLPTAPRAVPGESAATWRYFAETHHYLANGFLRFWETYGDVELFGYPISEEFDELDPQSGEFRTVQYFERARFVWAPAHPSALEGVVLDRIGVELAERLGLTATRAFRVAPHPRTEAADCRHFPETGHALCGGFLAAWQRTGAVSPQTALTSEESARRFTGLPISEPIALADGTIVQYFERARLEYRQYGDGDVVVTRGRLGAELLRDRGWLP